MDREPQAYEDRRHPHRLHSERYRAPHSVMFITMHASAGVNLCDDTTYRAITQVAGGMGRKYYVRIHAYCIMPDHVHFVVSLTCENGDVRKWVRYTKREIAKRLSAGGMWQRSYWDRHARGSEAVADVVQYTLANPVRRELCYSYDQWPYSWSERRPETQGADPNQISS